MDHECFKVEIIMNDIRFFDTTMRDGEQGIGYLLTNEQKLNLLKRLIKLGVSVIELGMVTDKESKELFEKALVIAGDTNIAALCRLNENDITQTIKVLRPFPNSTINLLCIGSELHLEKKIQISQSEALNLLNRTIMQVREMKFQGNIYAILEDSSRGSEYFLRGLIDHLIMNGIYNICFADTVGSMTPSSVRSRLNNFVKNYPNLNLSVHFHNDLGLAVANTIEAIEAGVKEVQVTLGGIGERCGNASFEEVIGILNNCYPYKDKIFSKIKLREIVNVCQYFYTLIGKKPNHNKPLLGENAFSTCAGIHQSAILKHPETYEFIDSESIGMKRSFHYNRLSSRKIGLSNNLKKKESI